MTDWAEYWIQQARGVFPHSDLYLVTGGNGNPRLGADFSAQARRAARYRAGIRITNQNDHYAESFILTRLTSSACRNYNGYFTTEESGVNGAAGVAMRLFDAVTSGARGAYFKGLITAVSGHGNTDAGRLGTPARGARILRDNRMLLSPSRPVIETAVYYPSTMFAIEPKWLPHFHNLCSKIRESFDFDLVDERMAADGILGKYRFTLILQDALVPKSTLAELKEYVAAGGILIVSCRRIRCLEDGAKAPRCWIDLSRDHMTRHGEGYTLVKRFLPPGKIGSLSGILENRTGEYPWPKLARPAPGGAGTYASRMENADLYFNPQHQQIFSNAVR
jgi:hypothetical protein